jgi:hypothetical protein
MKLIFLISFFFFTNAVFGQNYILPQGEFMDTTSVKDTICKDYDIFYYSVGGKYLKNSYTLLNEVQTFLQQQNKTFDGSGYITFRFKIDCTGNKMKKTQVLQTNEKYAAYHFNKELVNELYLFTNTLDKWKIAKNKEGKTFPYNAFISFKIKNGKVITVIP